MNGARMPMVLVALACLTLTACIRVRVHDAEALGITRCSEPETARDRWVLYLGRAKPDGTSVDATAWAGFLNTVVTPALPAGFTWHEAQGQWRDDTGTIGRESSWVLITLVEPAAPAPIRSIAEAYRRQFDQQAVLVERTRVCAALEQGPL